MHATASRSVACAFLSHNPAIALPLRSSRAASAVAANAVNMGMTTKITSSSYHPRSVSSTSLSSASFSSSSDGNYAKLKSQSNLSSSRGRNAVSMLPVYLTDARAVTKYHPTDSPDGALQLSVAENQMLEDLLIPALRDFSSSSSGSGLFHSDQIYYQATHGREGLRKAFASYLHRILKLDKHKGGHRLDEDGLVMGAGCNAVLENLCFCLTEPGDAVLLPTPYYAAFEFDLVARAGLNIVPVNTVSSSGMDLEGNGNGNDGRNTIPKEAYYPSRSSLDAAYENARENGSEPKILLLSHPNNPLGICYPPSVVKECIDWAREKQVHLVSDEIYAGSVYEQTDVVTGEDTFQSALALAAGHDESDGDDEGSGLGLGPYIHFVYALSKDLALSGLRVGVAYSENEEIRLPLQKLNDLCQISSQTQVTVEKMLSAPTTSTSTESFWSTDDFLPKNNDRIRTRSNRLQQCLDECDIPYLPGDSGLFLWMDFSEFLPNEPVGGSGLDEDQESMDARERALYLELLKEFGLLFTPGRSMKNELPGFFRCVFTSASDDEFTLGLKRIKDYVAAKRG